MTFLSCCKLDKTEIPFTNISLNQKIDLESVTFINKDTGIVTGGKRFLNGFICHTYNGGQTWSCDSLANMPIYDVVCSSPNFCVAVGFFVRHWRSFGDMNWNKGVFQGGFSGINNIDIYNDTEVIGVGGDNLDKGQIWVINRETWELKHFIDSIRHEFADVDFLEDGRAVACGYGIVQYSDDFGMNWTITDIQGDFFRAVDFPSDRMGYAVGQSGTIIKSYDGGESWEKIRNGNSIFVSDLGFRDVQFIDEDRGFVVGHDGLCWQTFDGGETWEEITNLPSTDFTDMTIIEDVLIIAGREGTVLSLQL